MRRRKKTFQKRQKRQKNKEKPEEKKIKRFVGSTIDKKEKKII